MKRIERIKAILLTVIAIEGAMTAWAVVKMAREGFSIEMQITDAEELLNEAKEAKEAALSDMEGEDDE